MTKFYQAKNLSRFPSLIHAFSTKHYGNLSWQSAKTKDKWEETALAQINFAKDLGVKPDDIISTFQTHSKKVLVIGPKNKKITAFPADGLVTSEHQVALMVHTADCLPVLFFDPVKKAAAAVHAGWRGVLNLISVETVLTMQKEFGSKPEHILVAVGPCLGPCHFNIKEDVWRPFKQAFSNPAIFIKSEQGLFLDMREAIKEQLLKAGIKESNIEISRQCTYCEAQEFSSFRRDKNLSIAMGSLICLS